MPQLSKSKFIVLALIIIAITVFTVICILSNNNNKVVNNSDNEIVKQPSNVSDNRNNNSNNNNSSSNVNNTNKEENIPLTFEYDNNEDNTPLTFEYNNEDEIGSKEDNMDNSEVFVNIQKRIEVVTDNNSRQIFNNMFTPTKAEIETFMGIDLKLFDSYLIRMNQSKFSGEMYMVFKPFKDNKDEAKAQIKKFLLSYESSWEKLNENQYNLVSNRTAIERNGYLVYIISIENNIIMNEIRNFI